MRKAIVAKDGAKRLNMPEMEGEMVEFDKLYEPGLCTQNVYYKGERLTGRLSIAGDTPALMLCDEEVILRE